MMESCDEWSSCEPLNLSIKKRPIAVVAPSSVATSSENQTDTMLLEKPRIHRPFEVSDDDSNSKPSPQPTTSSTDLTDEVICLDLSKKEENRVTDNNLTGNEKLMEYFAPFLQENQDGVLSNPESIYSMINHLAEQKLIQALYMNTLIAQSNQPNLAAALAASNYVAATSSTDTQNSKHQYPILNNLLGANQPINSRKLFENSEFYKSKTEALSITVPTEGTYTSKGKTKHKRY